jgi:hypothetical protein
MKKHGKNDHENGCGIYTRDKHIQAPKHMMQKPTRISIYEKPKTHGFYTHIPGYPTP